MRYVVVAGVGRSGTTFLARLMALSTTPMKVVMEPFARAGTCPDNGQVEPFSVLPGSQDVTWAREILESLTHSNHAIQKGARAWTVERNDAGAEVLLVKVTHSLLALPEILDGLDYRCVVIVRDTARVIDSFFHGHKPHQRHYLQDEFKWMDLKSPCVIDEVMRQALMTSAVKLALASWVIIEPRATCLEFERLCQDPVCGCRRAFDALGLGYDEETGEGIARMTHGGESGYYDTKKDSGQVLWQGFKFLTPGQVEEIRCL